MNRRTFIVSSGAVLTTTACSTLPISSTASQRKLRMAIVGTGARGSFTRGREVVRGCRDVVEIVGLCDHNGKRVAAAQKLIGPSAPTFTDFDRTARRSARGRTLKPDRHCGATQHRARRAGDQNQRSHQSVSE